MFRRPPPMPFCFLSFVIHSMYQGPQTKVYCCAAGGGTFNGLLFGMQRMLLTGIVVLTLSSGPSPCSASTKDVINPEAAMSTVRVNYINCGLPNVNCFEYFQSLGGDHPFTRLCLHHLSSDNRGRIHSGITSNWFVEWKTRFTPARLVEHRCRLDYQSVHSIVR